MFRYPVMYYTQYNIYCMDNFIYSLCDIFRTLILELRDLFKTHIIIIVQFRW